MSNPQIPPTAPRELDERDLDAVVGGTDGARAILHDLVHADLLGHDQQVAHDNLDGILNLTDDLTGKDIVEAIKTNAAEDGRHSGDKQLSQLVSQFQSYGLNPGFRTYDVQQELLGAERQRVTSGETAHDLAQLVGKGAISGADAADIIETNAAQTGTSQVTALAQLEAATGGDRAVEGEIGRLVSGGASTDGALAAIKSAA